MCVLRLLFIFSFIIFSMWYSVLELCFRCYDPFDNGYDRFSEHDDRLSNGYVFYNEHGPGGGMSGPGQAGLGQRMLGPAAATAARPPSRSGRPAGFARPAG